MFCTLGNVEVHPTLSGRLCTTSVILQMKNRRIIFGWFQLDSPNGSWEGFMKQESVEENVLCGVRPRKSFS